MYKTDHMDEVREFIKNSQEHKLQTSVMAQINGLRGNQFGKEVYTALLDFQSLYDFLTVFPEVQREINSRKVRKIKNYTLSGLELLRNAEKAMRFFPGITCTARGYIFYDDTTNKIAIDTNNSKFSINDGQHRFLGINAAIEQLKDKIDSLKDKEEKESLVKSFEQLKAMTIPLAIFANLSEEEEKQLFSDTNNLAQRPSRSATIKLAQTDIFSRMAREISESNRYLKYYGVEYDKMSIHKSNPNTVLLTSVYNGIKEMFNEKQKFNRNNINEETYEEYKKLANKTFDRMFQELPPDLNVKNKYIIDKSFSIRAICKFINDCRYKLMIEEDDIFAAINKVNWKLDKDYWINYRANITKNGLIVFGGSGDQGKVAIYDALMDNLDQKNLVRFTPRTDKESKEKIKAN